MRTVATSRAEDLTIRTVASAALALALLADPLVTGAAHAQQADSRPSSRLDGASRLGMFQPRQTTAPPSVRITPLTGVWIEGPGYDITYGKSYDVCAARCLATFRCVMIEYYRPERKCNLYAELRPRKPGGASIVGLRQVAVAPPEQPRLVAGPAPAVRPPRDR